MNEKTFEIKINLNKIQNIFKNIIENFNFNETIAAE